MRRSIVFVLTLTLAGCALGTDPLPPERVGPGYAEGGGTFNTGTRVTVRAKTFDSAGKVGVCAAWAVDGPTAQTMPHHDDVLGIGVVRLGGRNVLQGFDTFPRAPDRTVLGIAPANCVRTGHDWRAADAARTPRIDFARIVLDREDDSGVVLWFRGD